MIGKPWKPLSFKEFDALEKEPLDSRKVERAVAVIREAVNLSKHQMAVAFSGGTGFHGAAAPDDAAFPGVATLGDLANTGICAPGEAGGVRRVMAQETAEDGCTASACRVMMTNYERVRDGDMDPEAFTATSLDEASVLRSFGSKTYQTFLDKFRGVRYKLVSTATPSPNRYKELIHYAGYLDAMDTGQALTRFFQRDSTKANNLTLSRTRRKNSGYG